MEATLPDVLHRLAAVSRRLRLPLLALGLLVAAALAAEAGRLPRYGGSLRLDCAGIEPRKLDPLQLHGDDGALLAACLYEGLTRWGPERVEPVLATRWFQSDDAKRWLFHLRPGVRFHDASPCDAQAVSLSLHELAHPARSAHTWILRSLVGWEEYARCETAQIEGIYIISATEMELHFLEPVVDLPARLALHCAGIAHRAGATPSGTGPFRLAAAAGDSVRLVPYEGHRDGAPFLQSLVFVRAANAKQETQVLRRLDPAQRPLPGITLVRAPARRLGFALFHPGSAAFATPAARQAVAAAFDAPVFVRAALGGDGEPAFGLQPDAAIVRAFQEEDSLAAPSTHGGTTVRILVPAGEPMLSKLAERLQLHLGHLGFRASIEGPRGAPSGAAHRGASYDIAVLGWTPMQGHGEDIQETTRVLSLLSDILSPALGANLPPPWRDLLEGRTRATEAALNLSGAVVPLVFFHDVWQAPDGADNLQPSPAGVGLGLQNVHLRFVGP